MGPYFRKSLLLRIELLTNIIGGRDPVCILQSKRHACNFFKVISHNIMNADGAAGRDKNSQMVQQQEDTVELEGDGQISNAIQVRYFKAWQLIKNKRGEKQGSLFNIV